MKLDNMHIYFKVAHWTHSVMFEPWLEFMHSAKARKELSKKMFTDAWWCNADAGMWTMDVYAKYYLEYRLGMKELGMRIRLAKFEVDWKIQRMFNKWDSINFVDDYFQNSSFDIRGSDISIQKRWDEEAGCCKDMPIEHYLVRYVG